MAAKVENIESVVAENLAKNIAAYFDAKGLKAEAASDLEKAQNLMASAKETEMKWRSEAAREERENARLRAAEAAELERLKLEALLADNRGKAKAEEELRAAAMRNAAAAETRKFYLEAIQAAVAGLKEVGQKAAAVVEAASAAANPLSGIQGAWEDVKSFAKAHPWLTAALVVLGIVAVGFLAYTAYDWMFGMDTSADGVGVDAALRAVGGR